MLLDSRFLDGAGIPADLCYTLGKLAFNLIMHARLSAIETPSGARTEHGKENANLPTL